MYCKSNTTNSLYTCTKLIQLLVLLPAIINLYAVKTKRIQRRTRLQQTDILLFNKFSYQSQMFHALQESTCLVYSRHEVLLCFSLFTPLLMLYLSLKKGQPDLFFFPFLKYERSTINVNSFQIRKGEQNLDKV